MISYRRRYGIFWAIWVFVLFFPGMSVYAAHQEELLAYLDKVGEEGTVYEVKPDGTGDFFTIQEGVYQVDSGDTLLIYPGIYEENVVIMDKTVNLVGIDRDTCIIMADAANYHHIPLTVGAGKVYNLTICGTNEEKNSPDKEILEGRAELQDLEDVYLWQNQFLGYAVHVEQEYSVGKTLTIENCRIISNSNQCIGIGLRADNTVEMIGCELLSNWEGGCVYLHNTSYMTQLGEAQFIMRDCTLKNYVNPYVISVDSMGGFNPVYLTFQNVKVCTVAYEDEAAYSENNINTWYTVDQLQAAEVKQLLREGVFYSSLGDDLVRRYSRQEYLELRRQMEEQTSLLEGWAELAEGINYLEFREREDGIVKWGTVRHVISVKNIGTEAIGDGWCGLSCIYLTNESYGNTLPEMNYPRM